MPRRSAGPPGARHADPRGRRPACRANCRRRGRRWRRGEPAIVGRRAGVDGEAAGEGAGGRGALGAARHFEPSHHFTGGPAQACGGAERTLGRLLHQLRQVGPGGRRRAAQRLGDQFLPSDPREGQLREAEEQRALPSGLALGVGRYGGHDARSSPSGPMAKPWGCTKPGAPPRCNLRLPDGSASAGPGRGPPRACRSSALRRRRRRAPGRGRRRRRRPSARPARHPPGAGRIPR